MSKFEDLLKNVIIKEFDCYEPDKHQWFKTTCELMFNATIDEAVKEANQSVTGRVLAQRILELKK